LSQIDVLGKAHERCPEMFKEDAIAVFYSLMIDLK